VSLQVRTQQNRPLVSVAWKFIIKCQVGYTMLRIGFLGPKGTFSQEAMLRYVGNRKHDARSYATISEMLFAVCSGEIEEAIAPIENSLEGPVSATMDIMANEVDLKIKGELVIAVKQNLLVKKGTKFEDIEYIVSHPQPVGQCRKYINSHLPHAKIKYVYSTASAALEVAEGENNLAAIGSVTAAEVYRLDILCCGIQDEVNNFTRFVIVSKEDSERTGFDKTSIVFSTEDKPGSLYRILDIFNLWDINMTRIESRPARNELGKYIFFIDIEGHREDDDIKDALTMVKRKTSFFKFLGSYPAHRA
jgi:prephenate dehydratase